MKTMLDFLKEDALKTGVEVTLASGQKSDFYVDSKQVSLFGPSLTLMGQEFWKKISEHDPKVDAIAGVSLGGDPIASSVILEAHKLGMDINAYLIRKESKGHGATEGGRVEGRRDMKASLKSLWLVEDVVSTGGSSLSAAEHLIEQGYPLKGVCCLLDREMGGLTKISEALNIPALSLYRLSEVLNEK